ncbi:tRNA-splicing endonuclease subunit Sen2 isoform X2 [Lagopus leucura]|uniref:tRNA-splicing endonuclease subunit Sen2 isoform X2 n=1 Tax=Lagopus leucura TaxID=30410 RepID=UPI001C681F5E|nr:tRNA-splicing endonuclease subunit Sen2 isoform X2 [Lagopus leucura]
MAEAAFRPPRRKRRVFECYQAPFPVGAGGGDFRMCRADMVNNSVVVRSPEDVERLYNEGYFGKGILSRSRPMYSISDPSLVSKWQGANLNMPIITSKKYQQRVQWAKSALQEQGFDSCSVTKILENYTRPLEFPFLEKGGAEQTGDGCDTMGPNTENAELSRQSAVDTENTATSSPEPQKEVCQKACAEGDLASDPVVALGSEEQEPAVVKEAAQASCQKHGSHVHCGCKAKGGPERESSNMAKSGERAPEYVLVQEEEEGSLCPEEGSAHEQENAFFLVYALGCLTVYYGEEPLTILKLWEIFSEVKPSFKTTYMAYHYFRSKGWVPKVGLKYGTDLLLYRKGPPFYHASYSVIAELVDDNFEGSLRRPLSWMSLSGLNRTTVNASKELMLCYLIKPSDMTEEEMATPECLKRIKVQELIVTRWVSSRERSEQDDL